MLISPPTNHTSKSPRRSGLPLLLYDLSAAHQTLPPAAVLPEQFFHAAKPHGARGEVALMRAVLEDAFNCFQKLFSAPTKKRSQRLAREAERWFFDNDTRWPFSFVNICVVLGLDPGYIRLGLKRWQQQHATEPQKVRRRASVSPRPLKIAA
jgi:hypothetical protein